MARKTDGFVQEKDRVKIKKPDMYKVVLHNDDYTTQEFVIRMLQVVFHKPAEEAVNIMLDVHKKGRGVVGVYTYDIAATKITQVRKMAEREEYPLRCTMEKA